MNGKVLIWLLLGFSVQAAEFYNLDFDSPNLSNLREIEVFLLGKIKVGTVSDLFPGWSVVIDGSQYSGDAVFLTHLPDIPVLGYHYSVYYDPYSFSGPNGGVHRLSISQIGLVPFWASELISNGNTLIYANNTLLMARPTGLHFDEYAWDVSRYAGQEVRLEVKNYFGDSAGLLSFDIIGFSAPEPSEWVLMLAGGCALFWFGGRARGRR